MLRRRALTLLAAPLLLAPLACSDDDGGGGGGGAFGSGSSFSVESALAEIPSRFDTDGVTVQIGDLVAASEAAGIDRPSSAGDEALIPWAMRISSAGDERDVFVPIAELLGQQYLALNAEIDAELGWSIVDVDAFVEALIPPHAMLVAVGDGIDPERVRGAEVVEVGEGVVTAGEGEDLSFDLEGRTAARPLGRPVRMAPQDGRIAVGRVLTDIERWADDEPDDTLADIDAYVGVARHLDAAEPYAASILRLGGMTDPRTEMALADIDSPRLTASYDLIGIAWSHVDGEPVITLVHRWTGESAATEQAEQLRAIFTEGVSIMSGRPLTDLVTLEEVTADGAHTITTLSLPGDSPAIVPYQMVMGRELPFLTPM